MFSLLFMGMNSTVYSHSTDLQIEKHPLLLSRLIPFNPLQTCYSSSFYFCFPTGFSESAAEVLIWKDRGRRYSDSPLATSKRCHFCSPLGCSLHPTRWPPAWSSLTPTNFLCSSSTASRKPPFCPSCRPLGCQVQPRRPSPSLSEPQVWPLWRYLQGIRYELNIFISAASCLHPVSAAISEPDGAAARATLPASFLLILLSTPDTFLRPFRSLPLFHTLHCSSLLAPGT